MKATYFRSERQWEVCCLGSIDNEPILFFLNDYLISFAFNIQKFKNNGLYIKTQASFISETKQARSILLAFSSTILSWKRL